MVKKRNVDVIESIAVEILLTEAKERNELKKSIGRKIRQMRLERGWTQEYLARNIGMNRKHISYYENARVLPTERTLSKLADAFGVEVDEFFPE